MLTKKLFNRVVAILLPEMSDSNARKPIVESALIGSSVLQKIDWTGPARPFTTRLTQLLDQFGEIETGRPALVALLEEVKELVGVDRQAQFDSLLIQLSPLVAKPSAQPKIQPPTNTVVEGEHYVFISYARPDQSIAEKVEAFLSAAGIRVFRDTSDIGAGENWDMVIEQALGDCHCMVLLLSPASMPHRKEVHREWFRFDRKGKTIYPLYIQECELHSRFDSRNYIDARTDLQGAIEHLLNALRRDFDLTALMLGGERASALKKVEIKPFSLPEALQSLLETVRTTDDTITVPQEQANLIKEHKPANLMEFHLCRIAEWSLPRYHLDKRFVNLTLLLDKGEQELQRWQRTDDYLFHDLRDVIEIASNDPTLVLLGSPGSGKSTLLRRLQLDHSTDRLRDGAYRISFFIQLNGYRARANGELPDPREWLSTRWKMFYPLLPPLEIFLQQGCALLLLDALNEMPHKDAADYHHLVSLWRIFAQETSRQGNRILFSCRSLDYSASLSSHELRVPQVEVQPMNAEQVREFLRTNAAAHEERIWRELDGSPQFSLFQTPYFLKLLCEQVEEMGDSPKGRAALFTGFVRQALERERHSKLFQMSTGLLSEMDHEKINLKKWRNLFELPERGVLIPKLSDLAYTLQQKGLETEGAQVRIDYDDACDQISHPDAEKIVKAGIALNVLDKDVSQDEIIFFHQLLQEYFPARRLAKEPDPALIHVEWSAEKACPAMEDTLVSLADGDPLPPLQQTGWEETTLTAAPMATDPQGFIRNLIPHNLVLAARCAISPEVMVSNEFRLEIQSALLIRMRNSKADMRDRISAGEALGTIGDPRFERRTGRHGDHLLPPMVEIPGGSYPMGLDNAPHDREKPAHTVELHRFQIGKYPVTNAEYQCFIESGGYDNEQWWDTDESKAWLCGEATAEGVKQQWRDNRKNVQGWSEDQIFDLVKQNKWTTVQAEDWIKWRNWTDEQYDEQLDEWYPAGQVYRRPKFWDDTRFNNPSQPVVGVTWFEARAYCNWLTANSEKDRIFRLPTEAEFEAAARGPEGRIFPYGKTFDSSRSNTFESHIRRTTPTGIFDNATLEGAIDLSGNVSIWTISIYDQERFPYPYRSNDGREDIWPENVKRVLRGGSWSNSQDNARAVYRNFNHPAVRVNTYGFRVVFVLRSPSR